VEFLQTLGEVSDSTAEVWFAGGELWAEVDGFQVRLGRPEEMTTKALALTALLSEPLPEGSLLILVAPAYPAVSPPATSEGEDEAGTTGETGDS
jgi:hypothetical protein